MVHPLSQRAVVRLLGNFLFVAHPVRFRLFSAVKGLDDMSAKPFSSLEKLHDLVRRRLTGNRSHTHMP